VTYNIVLKVCDDPKGKWPFGRSHRNWSEADAFVAQVYRNMKVGESRRIAYEVQNIYSGLDIPWIYGDFIIHKEEDTRYEDGSFKELVLLVHYPEYAHKLIWCV
jgi:hypothetical protein